MSDPIAAISGQGWARVAVGVGAVLSVAGNWTETALTDSPVSLGIRIPIAVSLPMLVFIAVEVFVRVAWRKTVLDFAGRVIMLTLPALGAGYVSFGHLYSLSIRSGADQIAATANALAIDGIMIGGTVALLAIRAARLAEQIPSAPPALVPAAKLTLPELEELEKPRETTELEQRAADALGIKLSNPRKPRAASGEQEKAVRMMLDGQAEAAVSAGLIGASTMRRYQQVWRALKANPSTADFGSATGKVQPDLVNLIRTSVIEGAL